MSELDIFDSIAVPDPLSVQLCPCPFNIVHKVIVDGPPGAVELQIRPVYKNAPHGFMAIEYHSRQPMPTADTAMSGCEVLDGAPCYPDGTALDSQSELTKWFRARDGKAIIDDLVSRHQAAFATLGGEDTGSSREVPPWG